MRMERPTKKFTGISGRSMSGYSFPANSPEQPLISIPRTRLMNRQSKFWYLKHFNIFEGMDEASMEKVNQMSSMSSVRSQQPLYFPDEPTQAIFFLKEGHVKISRLAEDGKEMILRSEEHTSE